MRTEKYIRKRHSVTLLKAHLIFVTKYRKSRISGGVLDTLMAAITKAAIACEATVEEINGEDDHIHMLVCYPPKVSVAEMVSRLKSESSREVLRAFPALAKRCGTKEFWSPSYFAVSVGGAPIEVLRAYIQNQASPD